MEILLEDILLSCGCVVVLSGRKNNIKMGSNKEKEQLRKMVLHLGRLRGTLRDDWEATEIKTRNLYLFTGQREFLLPFLSQEMVSPTNVEVRI